MNVARLNLDAMKETLHRWMFREAGGVLTAVIWMDENIKGEGAPMPRRPFGSLKLISREKVGGIDEMRQDSPGNFTLAKFREFVLSVNVFGDLAHEILGTVLDSLDRQDVVQEFSASGF